MDANGPGNVLQELMRPEGSYPGDANDNTPIGKVSLAAKMAQAMNEAAERNRMRKMLGLPPEAVPGMAAPNATGSIPPVQNNMGQLQ